jgi:Na+/proline symporter
MNALMGVPAAILFFSIGTGLYLYFKAYPAHLDPGMAQADAIFPWYMVTRLPLGVAGLLIAGIFAASQSTLSSSVNAAATALTMDFYRLFFPGQSDRGRVRFARWMTVLIGGVGIAIAMMMAGWNVKSLWDQLGIYIGLFSSGLAGLFLLGMLTRRANGAGALVGLVVSAFTVWWVKDHTPLFFMMYAFVGIVVSFGVGYVASLLTGGNRKDIEGLSVQTQQRRSVAGEAGV